MHKLSRPSSVLNSTLEKSIEPRPAGREARTLPCVRCSTHTPPLPQYLTCVRFGQGCLQLHLLQLEGGDQEVGVERHRVVGVAPVVAASKDPD